MKLVVTVAELRYGGMNLKKGDTFETSDRDGKILKAVRKAADVATVSAAPAPRPRGRAPAGRTGDMQFPEQPKPTEESSGLYGRRDMRAED